MEFKKAESMSEAVIIALRQQPECLSRFLGPFWPATVVSWLDGDESGPCPRQKAWLSE